MLIKFLDGTKRGVEIKHGANLSGADLSYADLSGADLHGANLRGADLSNANLSGANLSGAYLRGAALRSADLSGAYLRGADLHDANLRGADLSGADLSNATLIGANLSGAYLSYADLSVAYLNYADLSGAYLSGADLKGAYLKGANLIGAKGLAVFKICPEVGQFIGFKKVNGSIITLLIPADAKRVNAYGSRKCRAEFAYVLRVDRKDHKGRHCLAAHNGFVYPTSGLVMPDKFDPDPCVECSHGIHFFITQEEAVEY